MLSCVHFWIQSTAKPVFWYIKRDWACEINLNAFVRKLGTDRWCGTYPNEYQMNIMNRSKYNKHGFRQSFHTIVKYFLTEAMKIIFIARNKTNLQKILKWWSNFSLLKLVFSYKWNNFYSYRITVIKGHVSHDYTLFYSYK